LSFDGKVISLYVRSDYTIEEVKRLYYEKMGFEWKTNSGQPLSCLVIELNQEI